MSDDPTTPAGREDMAAVLERFESTSRSAMARLESIQAEITALVPPPVPVAVHAEMDAAGLVTSLTIDGTAARGMAPELLEGDLNVALKDAARRRPASEVPDVRRAAESLVASARSQGTDPAELVRALLAGSSPEPDSDPQWNDRRTVAVTLLAGSVPQVRCAGEWLETAALHEIAAQVRQAVNDAVARTNGTSGGPR